MECIMEREHPVRMVKMRLRWPRSDIIQSRKNTLEHVPERITEHIMEHIIERILECIMEREHPARMKRK